MRSDPLVPTCSTITVRPTILRVSVRPMKFEPRLHSDVQAESAASAKATAPGAASARTPTARAGALATAARPGVDVAVTGADTDAGGETIARETGDACTAG